MRRVYRRRSGYAGHVFRRGDGGRYLFGIGALRVLYRVVDEQVRVVPASGECRGVLVGIGLAPLLRELLLYVAHEFLRHIRRVGERSVAESFDGVSAYRNHLGVVHSVAAEDAEGRAELARLAHDYRAFRKVSRDVEDVGVFADYLGQLRREVLVTLLVVHDGDHFAAELHEILLEEVAEADAVVLRNLDEHRRGLRLELRKGEVSRARALERVDEADAEDVLLALRDERVRARRADHRDPSLLRHFAAGHRERRAVGSDYRADLLALYETLDGVRRLDLVALVVDYDELDLLAVNLGILLVREIHAVELKLAADRVSARDRQIDAYLDSLRRRGDSRRRKDDRESECKPFGYLHTKSPLL